MASEALTSKRGEKNRIFREIKTHFGTSALDLRTVVISNGFLLASYLRLSLFVHASTALLDLASYYLTNLPIVATIIIRLLVRRCPLRDEEEQGQGSIGCTEE